MEIFPNGPYLTMAVVCERIMEEKDGVLSLIRLVDQVMHHESGPLPPQDMPAITYPLSFVIGLKKGSARGQYDLAVKLEPPSGILPLEPIMVRRFRLDGPENGGVNVMFGGAIPFPSAGLYWFHVHLDALQGDGQKFLTKIPLLVLYERLQTGGFAPGPGT